MGRSLIHSLSPLAPSYVCHALPARARPHPLDPRCYTYSMDDDKASALPDPSTSAPVATSSVASDLLAGLPRWQRAYLVAIAAGLTEQQACASANVTAATISDWSMPGARAYDPVFARAEQMIRQGVAIVGREHVRADAHAEAYVARRDAFMESRGLDPATGEPATEPIVSYKTGEPVVIGRRPAIRAQDRVANRRLVMEAAGAIGQGAQVRVQVHQSLNLQPAPAIDFARTPIEAPVTQETPPPQGAGSEASKE